MAQIKKEDLIWAAGIIDGEGCFRIQKQYPSKRNRSISVIHSPRFYISMVHRPSIERLFRIFDMGTVCPVTKPKTNHLQQWGWGLGGRDLIVFIKAIRPFLFTKAEETDCLLKFYEVAGWKEGRKRLPKKIITEREKLYQRCKSLKKHEWSP